MKLSEHSSPRGRISDNRRIKIDTVIIPVSFSRFFLFFSLSFSFFFQRFMIYIYTHTVRTLMKHRPHLSPRMFRVLTGPACIFNAKLPPAIFPAISFIASHSASLLFIFLTPRKFYIPCFCSFLSLSLSLSIYLSLSLSLARSPFSINIAIEIPFRLSIRLLFIRSLLMFSFFHV